MSLAERGEEEAVLREREQAEREKWRQEENRQHTIRWFRRCFYSDHIVLGKSRGLGLGYGEDPDNPFPPVEDWTPDRPGDSRSNSTFTCEGLRWICRWKLEGAGGDRAYWDDGWWPEWLLVLDRPRRWLPFLKRRTEVSCWTPEGVATALRGER